MYPLNQEAYDEWLKYRRTERKPAVTENGKTRQINLLTQYPEEVQRVAIDDSMTMGYQGLFPHKFRNVHTISRSSRDTTLEEDLNNRAWAL